VYLAGDIVLFISPVELAANVLSEAITLFPLNEPVMPQLPLFVMLHPLTPKEQVLSMQFIPSPVLLNILAPTTFIL
jgi:hypothetical protein